MGEYVWKEKKNGMSEVKCKWGKIREGKGKDLEISKEKGEKNQGDKEKEGKDKSKERASRRDEERRNERKILVNVYWYISKLFI